MDGVETDGYFFASSSNVINQFSISYSLSHFAGEIDLSNAPLNATVDGVEYDETYSSLDIILSKEKGIIKLCGGSESKCYHVYDNQD
ncbi:MAG: hypothetical protein HRT72_03760 [Flavobacteriales bacterium]|nr:hypothetical protein [Flavobacteriales bacterium]